MEGEQDRPVLPPPAGEIQVPSAPPLEDQPVQPVQPVQPDLARPGTQEDANQAQTSASAELALPLTFAVCYSCQRSLEPQANFTRSQLKKGPERRCNDCVAKSEAALAKEPMEKRGAAAVAGGSASSSSQAPKGKQADPASTPHQTSLSKPAQRFDPRSLSLSLSLSLSFGFFCPISSSCVLVRC